MSEAGAPRSRNLWLIVSVCLNVVLLAMLVVGFVRAMHFKQEASLGRAFTAQSIVAHLPPDRAQRIEAIMARHAARIAELTRDADAARHTARLYFMASPFDQAGYTQAQQKLRAANDALEAERLRQLGDIAVVLTPAERREVVGRARRQDTSLPFPR